MSTTNNALNVSTGKPKVAGGIYRAPLGTTLPTDASTSLGSSFTPLGYIAQDGVKHNIEMESTEIRAWGGDLVLSTQNKRTNKFGFGMIESLKKETYETIYGESAVSGTLSTGIAVAANSAEPTEYVYVIELTMRDNAMKRIVIPDGKLTEIGEIVYKDDEAVCYPVTLAAQVDSSGNSHYEYIKKTVAT